jgi:uncharacterized protein (DUF433 family)
MRRLRLAVSRGTLMSTVAYPYIELRGDSVAMLAGTQTKVIEVVLDRLAHHWDADEIHRQHPHLSLAQIHAAFTYYYDHQDELDAQIQAGIERARQAKAAFGPSAVESKLRQLGRLP